MSGGALTILERLIMSDAERVVPFLTGQLSSPGNPAKVKTVIAGMLLEYRNNDEQAMKTVEAFLARKEELAVQINMLQAIARALGCRLRPKTKMGLHR